MAFLAASLKACFIYVVQSEVQWSNGGCGGMGVCVGGGCIVLLI